MAVSAQLVEESFKQMNQMEIKLYWFFNLNTSYVSAETPLYTLTALYPLNLLGIKKINISSQTLNTSNFSSAIGTTSLINSISVDQPPFGLIVYQNTGGAKFTLTNKDKHKIDLQLYDEDFNYINFNNINWPYNFVYILLIKCNFYLKRYNLRREFR